MQLAGSQETATCEFDIIDVANSVSATDEATLTVTEVSSATVLFGGFVRSRRITVLATGRIIHILATDYNSLLDRAIVISDKRAAGESDKTRLTYLMTTYGPQFSSDYTQIATLNASMPAQKFIAITLRQAIERVLGQASTKSSYYVDPTGRLVTYDRTVVTAAPFNVRVGTPLGGEIAPEGLEVDNDASNLANAVYIVGATAAGSGWFTDTTSIATYGRRERFFNAPDSDLASKASQVGLAVLADQKNPIPRGVFTTKSPNDGWRIGQSITINSTQHGLTNQSYRIARVTAHYLSGVGDREYTIEVGAAQVSMPALLSAAHGGGGGYPWHSPGGGGAWTPPIVTGTTVTGGGNCACNTPYTCGSASNPVTIVDTFTRTVASPGWGTSDDGHVWANESTQGTISVNGTRGLLTATQNGTVRVGTASGPWGGSSDVTIACDFILTGNASCNNGTLTMWVSNVANGYSFFIVVDTTNGQITDVNNAVAAFVPVNGGQYSLKWEINYAGGVSNLKVWTFGAVEPGWMISNSKLLNFTRDATSKLRIQSLAQAGVSSFTASIDNIFVSTCPPASSGQPYPLTYLRNGDGFTTNFSTLTPYQPGSVIAYVDGLVQSLFASDPVNGIFTLNFAPTSSQKVSASWTVA
ncbi:MAG: hypothetical protein NVS9B1_27300 [Candidatus Dormibacteraceae bacterium]